MYRQEAEWVMSKEKSILKSWVDQLLKVFLSFITKGFLLLQRTFLNTTWMKMYVSRR